MQLEPALVKLRQSTFDIATPALMWVMNMERLLHLGYCSRVLSMQAESSMGVSQHGKMHQDNMQAYRECTLAHGFETQPQVLLQGDEISNKVLHNCSLQRADSAHCTHEPRGRPRGCTAADTGDTVLVIDFLFDYCSAFTPFPAHIAQEAQRST